MTSLALLCKYYLRGELTGINKNPRKFTSGDPGVFR